MAVLCGGELPVGRDHSHSVRDHGYSGWLCGAAFSYTSDLGKVLDPVADKLTQAAMLFCLLTRFPLMILPLGIMVLKEFFMGVTGLMVIQKTGKVFGADWHGKVTTWLLYAMMILHVFWYNIPAALSRVLIAACVVMMLISLVLYGRHNLKALREDRKPE